MKFNAIKNEPLLKKILWLDAALGGSTALIGFLFSVALTAILGFSGQFIRTVSGITFLYGVMAFWLAARRPTSPKWLVVLVVANWFWTAISVILVFLHFENATDLGSVFLFVQVIVVGGLAFLEGRHLTKK